MDEMTKKALMDSIAHWDNNVRAKTPYEASVSGSKCALCNMFPASCNRCPVMERTGKFGCEDSPYHDARKALLVWCREVAYGIKKDALAARAEWRRKARAELAFLKSLLPENEQ